MIATLTRPVEPPASRVAASIRAVRRFANPPPWLSSAERRRADGMRDRSARDAWLTARLAAKRLVAARLPGWPADPPARLLAQLDIRSRDAAGRGVPPRVVVTGGEAAVVVSIAHADLRVLVATAPGADALGVDLTPAVAFARPGSRWWLTAAERADLRLLDPEAAAAQAATLWSVKEAVYKAWLAADPFRPLSIEVRVRHGRVVSCTALGRALPPAAIRTWRMAGHCLAHVHAPGRRPGGEA